MYESIDNKRANWEKEDEEQTVTSKNISAPNMEAARHKLHITDARFTVAFSLCVRRVSHAHKVRAEHMLDRNIVAIVEQVAALRTCWSLAFERERVEREIVEIKIQPDKAEHRNHECAKDPQREIARELLLEIYSIEHVLNLRSHGNLCGSG